MPKPLKIFHVTKWYPNGQDPQNGIFVQKQILACNKEDQAVLYWGSNDEFRDEFTVEYGIPTLRLYLPEHRKLRNAGEKWKSISQLCQKAWNGEKPDIIHLHIADIDQWIALEYAKSQKIPVLLTDHWSGYLDHRFTAQGILKKALKTALLKRVDVLSTISPTLAVPLKALRGKPVQIIPNVLDIEPFTPSQTQPKSFGVLADLDDTVKNISGVIQAFAAHVESEPDASLHIIGDGMDRSMLEGLVREHSLESKVKFYGRKDHLNSMKILSSVETVLINSRRETFSVVSLEAIALGKKLICSKCGGPETFLNDEIVRWVNVDDSFDLIQAMNEASKIPSPTPDQIHQQVAPYLAENVARQWKALYEKMLP